MFNFLRKRKYRDYSINPDEIFIDTLNVSRLNKQQFEGVIEKPITPRNIFFVGLFSAIIIVLFVIKLFSLQIVNGADFLERAENNILNEKPIFAERGIIYDRNDTELAWNTKTEENRDFLSRTYIDKTGFGHILGYVNYPKTDNNGNYWRKYIEGQAGLEKKYNNTLSGNNGLILFEVNALGERISENNIISARRGQNLKTTIDSEIQHRLYSAIQNQAENFNFNAGAGGIMDVRSGELLALTSYPEYDPYVLAEGTDIDKITEFFNNPQKPFLNRAISGLYSPGSTIKPFLALAALNEKLITENTKILSTGRIEIPNIYNPENVSVFRDWRPEGHGLSDVKFAIADSVNTFFYSIGGGYKNQKGLGIKKIEEYLRGFGVAKKTQIDFGNESLGTIPTPEWKQDNYTDGTWRLGDTYITSIGQFGFQVTVIQMLRSMGALANNGLLYKPTLIKGSIDIESVTNEIAETDYQIVRAGMRDAVRIGTAQTINVPFVKMTAKTGTSQVGAENEFYNSWIVGFFPYENPKYAYVIVMERGKEGGLGSASKAMREFIDDVEENYSEFWD